jgi:hypothetical protein
MKYQYERACEASEAARQGPPHNTNKQSVLVVRHMGNAEFEKNQRCTNDDVEHSQGQMISPEERFPGIVAPYVCPTRHTTSYDASGTSPDQGTVGSRRDVLVIDQLNDFPYRANFLPF